MSKARRTLFLGLALLAGPALAAENTAVVKAIAEYMDFNEYGRSLI